MKHRMLHLVRPLWRKRTKLCGALLPLLFLCVAIGIIAPTSVAHATDAILKNAGDSLMTGVGNGIIFGVSWAFFGIASMLLGLTMWLLEMMLQLAAYNGFVDAPAVVVGWFVVRDVANMFFIVVLLVIAFGTILGLEQYEWKKALAKLILAAIFINFSRTLIGWMIDVTHVFMISFLNAVQDAAGGNLIQMLNLDKALAMSGQDLTFGQGGNARENLRVDLFIAAFTAFLFTVVATLAIGAYMVVLLVRIVMLWILIVLSPIAFVLQALPQGKNYASEFWQELTKYLLVGPIAVFFLWLAFASLGNGDIGSHIGIKPSDSGDIQKAQQLGSGRTNQSVSLSLATRWDNLSAFVIAVAFLFVGLERVQKLGVKGGGVVSSAVGFGTKVATIASGVAAARWLGKKGLEKGVQKFPIIGTDSLKRKGIAIAGLAKYAKSRTPFIGDQARNRFAKKLETLDKDKTGWRKYVGKAASLTVGGVAAKMIETGGRADKRAEDWKKFIDAEQKTIEEGYSTSHSLPGQMKLDANVRLKEAERLSDAKGKKKYAERRQKLKDTDKRFAGQLGTIAETEAEAGGLEIEERRQKGLERAGGFRKIGSELAARAAEQQAASEIVEETQKFFNALNYDEKKSAGKDMVQQLQNARAAGAPKKQVDQLMRQAVSALTAAMATDSETGGDSFRGMLQQVGWTENVTEDNRMRAMASALSGRVVAPGGEEAAFSEVEAAYGDKAALNQAMRTLGTAFKAAAKDGAVVFGGLVNQEEDAQHRVQYRFGTDFGAAAAAAGRTPNRNQSQSGKDYWVERQNFRSVTGVGDFGSSDLNGNIVHMSPDDIRRMGEFFSGKNANAIANMQSAFTKSWNNANLTGPGADPASIANGIRQALSTVQDPPAQRALRKNLNTLITRLAGMGHVV